MANEIIVKILGDSGPLDITLDSIKGKAIGLAKEYAPVAVAIGLVVEGVKALFEGEELLGVNAQFEMLAENAGLAAAALKEGLVAASGGLSTESEIMKAANQGIVQLGSSAKQLPQLFELARKATLVFGGDVIENFKAMEQAIANGNTRALAHLGIVVDLKKAEKEFALEQGFGVDALTKAGRSQAVLNAALEQGKVAFKGMNENIRPATVAWQELKVSFTEITESLEKAWAQTIGPVTAKIIGAFKSVANALKNSLKTEFADNSMEGLQTRRADLEKQLETAKSYWGTVGVGAEGQKARIAQVRLQIELLDEEMRKHASQAHTLAPEAEKANKRIFGDPDVIAKDKLKIQEEMTKSRGEFLALQQKSLDEEQAMNFNNDETVEAQLRNRNARLINLDEQYEQQKQAMKLEFQRKGVTDEGTYQAQLDNLELAHQQKRKHVEQEANQFSKQMAQVAKTGIVNGLSAAFSGLGRAMAQGGDAFGAFEKAALSALGGIAIQMGSMLVMAGIGWSVIPGFQASAAAVAEGIALMILGGAMEGMAGGSSSSPGGGAGGGSTDSGSSPVASNTPAAAPQPGTMVQVHVHGNVFDNRQTGLAIVDAINDVFQSSGARIAQAAQ